MSKILNTQNALVYVAVVLILALGTWTFNINADVSVMKNKQDTHEALVAHKNTRQDQITKLASKFESHEHLSSHPEGQKKLTEIQTQQAVQSSQLKEIQKQLDRIIDKLDAR